MKRTFLQRIIARVFWKAEVRWLTNRIAELEKLLTQSSQDKKAIFDSLSKHSSDLFNTICRQEEYITRLKLRLEQLSRESRKNRINLP